MRERSERRKSHLLLGLTGGIACGKTTVANMFEELGAATIDFDVIARQVVEPGQPALENVVAYFGQQVLQKDGTLDRKRLSRIVFQDADKRRKLERLTHPPIFEAFFREVRGIAETDPKAIIQAVIPLLIEVNMQHLFDKILVVHIPEAGQIRRLAKRDRISESQAAKMVASQMPIEKKLAYADIVIRNDGPVEETWKQVQKVWQSLKTPHLSFLLRRNDRADQNPNPTTVTSSCLSFLPLYSLKD